MVDGIRKAPIEQTENGLIHALAQTTHEVAKASLAASAESESLTSIFLRWRREIRVCLLLISVNNFSSSILQLYLIKLAFASLCIPKVLVQDPQ